jgi:hypothetical protein
MLPDSVVPWRKKDSGLRSLYSLEITGDVATGAAKDNKEIDAKN